jgi:hypothetical protein
VESLPDIEAFMGQRIPVGSYDPAELPVLRPAHYAPRSFGDEEEDGPPPNQIHRPEHGRHDQRRAQGSGQAPAATPSTAAPGKRRRRRRHGGGRPEGGPQAPSG